MTDESESQPAQRTTSNTTYLPESKTAVLTDSNQNDTVIKNITYEQYNKISDEFMLNSTLSSTAKIEKVECLGAGTLMEAGIPPNKENKDTKKSE